MNRQKFKKFIRSYLYLPILASGLVIWSCVNTEDFENIKGVEWTGSYALPIINSSLSIKNLLPKQDTLNYKEDENGMIYLEYSENVLDYNIRNSFTIPSPPSVDKSYPLPAIKLPAINQTIPVTLSQIHNDVEVPVSLNDIVSIDFSSGSLAVTANNKSNSTITFTVNILNADYSTIGAAPFTNLAPGNTSTVNIPLLGKTMKKDILLSLLSPLPIAGDLSKIVDLSLALSADAQASQGEIILQEDIIITASEPLELQISPEQYHEFLLKAGAFNCSFSSDVNYTSQVQFSLPTFTQNESGAAFIKEITTSGTAPIPSSESLENYKVNLTTLAPAYNRFPLNINVSFKKSASTFRWTSTDKVHVDVNMANFDYKYLKGYFGNKDIPMENGSFKISIFESTLNTPTLSLKEPEITFNLFNDYGAPVQLNFSQFKAFREDKEANVLIENGNIIDIDYPKALGDPAATKALNITNQAEIFKLAPTNVNYSANAKLNVGFSSGNNFLTDTSKVRVEMKARINLWGTAKNIEVVDTLDNTLEKDIESVSVELVKLKVLMVNEFPLDARVQIYFADDNDIVTDSLFTPDQTGIIASSKVDANGELIQAGTYDKVIEVSKEKFGRLIKSPKLIIKGLISTAEEGSKDVKVKAGYKLDVKIGVQTKVNLKVNL